MDITTSKNIAFSLFTFSPVVLLAFFTVIVLLLIAVFTKKKVSYKVVMRACLKAIFYQFIFLLFCIAIGYLFYVIGSIKFIPLILILPVSTIVSFAVFIKICIKKRSELYA